MEVTCPKCKVKLRVPDEKISPEGTRFKCPKCATVLLVRKPARKTTGLDKKKVLLAVADAKAFDEMSSLLEASGFSIVSSPDGVDAMVAAVRELPYVAVLDAALPKIYGFEVCRRLKGRDDTKDMKVILFNSYYDKNKYKRPPASLYGADDYIEGHDVQLKFLNKVQALVSGVPIQEPPEGPSWGDDEEETTFELPPSRRAEEPSAIHPTPPEQPVVQTTAIGAATTPAGTDEWETKARRLARTMLSDVFLYNGDKAKDALRNGKFKETFVSEINEGKKIYESRIPKDVRAVGNYFEDEVNNYLENKKKNLDS